MKSARRQKQKIKSKINFQKYSYAKLTKPTDINYKLDILSTDTTSGACHQQSGMHTTSWVCVPPSVALYSHRPGIPNRVHRPPNIGIHTVTGYTYCKHVCVQYLVLDRFACLCLCTIALEKECCTFSLKCIFCERVIIRTFYDVNCSLTQRDT